MTVMDVTARITSEGRIAIPKAYARRSDVSVASVPTHGACPHRRPDGEDESPLAGLEPSRPIRAVHLVEQSRLTHGRNLQCSRE